jgi:RHS repeat-associated protein
VGGPGTGRLTLTATGTNTSDSGYFNVPIVSYGVSVTPNGATAPASKPYSSGDSVVFTIKNTGSTSNTYTFTCSGMGGVTCGPAPAAVTLAAGAQMTRTQRYSVGGPGTGTIILTASGTNASSSGSYTVPIAAVDDPFQSTVTNGAFSKDSRYVLQEQALEYDPYGRIKALADARGKVTRYQYGGNVYGAFLTRITRVGDAGSSVDSLTTVFTYNNKGELESIKDEAGTHRYFGYDALGRLTEVRNHGNTLVEKYDYQYSRNPSNNWTFDSTSPNVVTKTTYLQPSKPVVTREYLDGLGRPIQTNVQDGSTYYVTATQYDAMGREWRVWKPYPRTSSAYDTNFTTNATSWYNTYHATGSAKPYREIQYTADALSRVKKEIPEYIGTSQGPSVQYAYGVDAAAKQTYTEITDESGKKVRRYKDLLGNEVKIILGYGASEATTTTLAYDVLGRRTGTTDPRGLTTTYTVDGRGLVTQKTSPDAGTVKHKYDKAGNLRYTQDANQAAAGHVHFTSYDFAGRPLRSGVGSATFSSLDPDATTAPTLETTQTNWRTVWAYDAKPSNVYPWSLFWTQISPLTLSNVTGRLAAVASQSNGAWQVELYSYDADGRVARRYVFTQPSSGTGVLTALNTKTVYVRDLRGEITERLDSVGTKGFHHWYEYDSGGLLAKIYASTSATKPDTPAVTYTYRPSGEVASRQFAGGPVVPFHYTIRDQLEKIGDPESTSYPFSAKYSYHPNGTISEAEFYNGGTPATAKRFKYTFGSSNYDALNRLKGAGYSYWSGASWVSTAAYGLTGITYDKSGNLMTLSRYGQNGALVDSLVYTYLAGTNRLGSVTDLAGSTSGVSWDAESGSFSYDANGNLKTAPAPYSITAATYDHNNLPLSLTSGGTTTSYRYNHAGQRIAKQVLGGDTEFYLLDGATTLGVFRVNSAGSVVSHHFNVLAGNRVVGRQLASGARRYYHTDLLGSTRAVVEGATVVESYDYDPWGLLLAGRTLGSGTKEGFTSKERDAESGLDYFGARYYTPALGRWTSGDPLADLYPAWSPYTFVLNRPNDTIDPDGRFVSPIYDTNGNLLGTDNEGLKGRPIIMDAANFRQGMSHAEAQALDLGIDALTSQAARARFWASYESLPSRPDYDGRLTFMEAVRWYNQGQGQPLYVDARSLNLAPISVVDVRDAPGGYINTFGITELNTGGVYGHIRFSLINDRVGLVRLGREDNYLDLYDFPTNSWAGRIADGLARGKPMPYRIFCYICVNHVALEDSLLMKLIKFLRR